MQIRFDMRGVIVPLLTPFDSEGESLDEEALQGNIEWLMDKGVHGLMPCGTMGEAPLLTLAERKRILEITVATTNGRVPVMAHVGAVTTADTIELARHAADAGADALSVVTPYYFRLPGDAVLEHYCQVAEAVPDAPIFLYNIPQYTNNTISRAMAESIVARCPNVVGIKDSAGGMESLTSFLGLRDGTFQVVCGTDLLQLSALEAGAVGEVSGTANVIPEIVVGVYEAYAAGDIAGARAKQALLDQALQAMDNGGSLSLFKAIAQWRGLRTGNVRRPLPRVNADAAHTAADRLFALGVQPAPTNLHWTLPAA